MRNAVFTFKEFSVQQDKCPMKISTDSVLLGAWTNPQKAKTILDIGTGTGIIALMLAGRSSALIDAIDICEDACVQAKENFSNSKWNKKLNVCCTSLQLFEPKKKYDLIASNPPFFPCPKSHLIKSGAQIRFNHKLPFDELAKNVVRLLHPKGKFFVIMPVREGTCFVNEAEKRNLFLTDYIWVKTTFRSKFPKRILMRFEFSRKKVREDKLLIIQHENRYTDEYKELTKDFYLNF